MDKKRKTIITVLKDIGFSIDIPANLKEVDFLDVTLNLQNGTFRPYKKPNDKLLYIHSSSNRQPQIIKQLPNSISERLSKNSSDQEIFNTAKVEYKQGRSENLKQVPQNLMKAFNADNVIMTSQLMTSYRKINIASEKIVNYRVTSPSNHCC